MRHNKSHDICGIKIKKNIGIYQKYFKALLLIQ